MKDKIGLVYTAKQPQWTSCVSILSGLYKACSNFFHDQEIILYDYPLKAEHRERSELAQKILKDKVSRLIFINHSPNPKNLIYFLQKYGEPKDIPPLYFHVYGDFSYQASDWYHLDSMLRGVNLSIVCASHSQQRFVHNLIDSDEDMTDYCPFPVDNQLFKFDPSLRQKGRAKYNLNDEFVFLYTGRMSIQKNIVEMCREFLAFADNESHPCKLLLAGDFDDIGVPLFKINLPTGYYFFLWREFFQGLTPEQQERIVFLGPQPQADLVELYHAVDCYFSLSLYHDEDYGMSPVEALSCGTPAILTDWGGFPSFQGDGTHCDLVGVSIEKDGLNMDFSELKEHFKKRLHEDRTNETRQSCSNFYHQKFSVACMDKYLSIIHSKPTKPFPGFNWKLREIRNYIYEYPTKNSFYEEIYHTYISRCARNKNF